MNQMIVVPILPFRLKALGYTEISQHVSWLLFAYSCGIFTCQSTPSLLTETDWKLILGIFPVAFFFHRYPYRRTPMIVAVLVLQAALLIFMKVEVFAAMLVARFLQGGASSVVFSGTSDSLSSWSFR
jgi:MFS family permease